MPSRDADVSCLEDEYHTMGNFLHGSQPGSSKLAGEESNADISDEMEEIVTKIKQRGTKYRLDAAEQLQDASAPNIIEGIKKRFRDEREESGKKEMKRGGKRPVTATNCKKLEGILDQLPNFLANKQGSRSLHSSPS